MAIKRCSTQNQGPISLLNPDSLFQITNYYDEKLFFQQRNPPIRAISMPADTQNNNKMKGWLSAVGEQVMKPRHLASWGKSDKCKCVWLK